jgi:5-formyltetrahydrofolate cyclo-ligase
MKKQLRKEILEKRDSLKDKEIKAKAKSIKEGLFSIGEYEIAKTICFFVSFNSEVDTHGMIKEALNQGKKVCVPVVKGNRLVLSLINDFTDLKKKNKYGILEPSKINKVDKKEVDMIIVPGSVFDKRKHRIGYGKGYYDILLKDFKGLSVGICFDLQIIEKIPKDVWDEKLDMIITEKGIIK